MYQTTLKTLYVSPCPQYCNRLLTIFRHQNPVRQRAALTQPHFLEGPDAPYYFPVWKVIFKDDAAAKEACSALPSVIKFSWGSADYD